MKYIITNFWYVSPFPDGSVDNIIFEFYLCGGGAGDVTSSVARVQKLSSRARSLPLEKNSTY